MDKIEYAAAVKGQLPEDYRAAWFAQVRQLMAQDEAKESYRRAKARLSVRRNRERLKQKIRIMCML